MHHKHIFVGRYDHTRTHLEGYIVQVNGVGVNTQVDDVPVVAHTCRNVGRDLLLLVLQQRPAMAAAAHNVLLVSTTGSSTTVADRSLR